MALAIGLPSAVSSTLLSPREAPFIRSTDTTSFSGYQRRLREHHERLRQTGRPLYITSDGEPDAVVKQGRVRPFRAAIHEIAAQLGLKLNT